MKKLSKILCAVLVLAILCSSLIFLVGAEEELPAFSFEPADTQMTKDAVLYSAEDNLITDFSRQTNTANGWNGEGARQAYVVTNNATGETYYREWFEDDAYLLKDGGEPAGVGGNEYIQFNFEKQSLVYEEGYHEYVIVDMDLAHKAKTVNIWDKTKYVSSANLKQEVIGRSSAGTSWSTVQNYKDFGLGDGFKHVTAIYDYTSAVAYIFTNGKLVQTVNNGALTAAVNSAYLSGTTVEVSEWRIGSNSADEIHMDNAYVRYSKVANGEDTIAQAIASGNLSAWNGNIFDENYVLPTPYWFVKSAEHTEVADYIGKINTTTNTVLDTDVAGNLYNGCSTSIGNGVDVLGAKQTTAEDLTYVTFYANQNGNIEKKNVFWQFNTVNAPNVSVAADSTAYYVVDFDIATHGEALPYIDISVMLRRVSDGGGFPFSPNIDVAPYIDPNGAWNHITIVGDMGANVSYLYVNGVNVATLAYAYNASQLSGNTELSPKGIRVDLGLSAETFPVSLGQNIAFDNFAQRVYTTASSSNGLDAAVAAGNLNTWADNATGNSGRLLPVIATVNGTNYYNSEKLATALISNEKLEVEYFSMPFAPAVLQASATVKTNGFELAKLFTLAPSCEILSNEDGVLKTFAPFAENRVVEQVAIPGGVNMTSIFNAIKYNHPDNLFNQFTPISLQKDGKYQPTWGSEGFRNGELVTNTDTGEVFYRESAKLLPDGTMAEGYVVDANGNVVGYKEADKGSNTFIRSNEYVNFYFKSSTLQYESGKTEYIVIDFDFGTDDVIDEAIAVQLIPRVSGSGSWASDIYLKSLPVAPGEMAHITLVADYTTNNVYVFVNGIYAYTVEEGAMDGDHSGGRNDGSKWADRYLKGEKFTISEFKLGSDRKTGTVCFDNVAIRLFDLNNSEDVIKAAVDQGDITAWSGSIYNENYKTTEFPALAKVDGVNVGSVDALNEALAVETDSVKEVYLKHTPNATIKVVTEANVETNGLAVDFDYETGLYKFHHDNPYYVCTGTDYAYASNRLVLVNEENSTVYKFETINQYNADANSTPVVWFYSTENDAEGEKVDVVFYVYGDQIAPLNTGAYIENGVMYINAWSEMDQDFNVGDIVSTFPVASNAVPETWYLRSDSTTEADFAADDFKQGANVSSNIQYTVYVKKDQTLTDGDTVILNGEEYVAYTFEFAPHQITKDFVIEFYVADAEGNVYLQRETFSFMQYAEQLLAESDELTKALTASILQYSNEAYKLANGETFAEVDALLSANADLLPDAVASEVKDTAELSKVIRSAALRLDSTPEFLFKVARGFKGTVKFSYTGINGLVEVSKYVDASDWEQVVVLDGFDVADIYRDINITATSATETVTGTYNLSTYAAGLENAAFANALIAYAQAAKAYQEHYALYVDGKFNVTDLGGEEAVASATLRSITASKIKQFDQSNKSSDTTSDYFVEGGAPRFVTVYKNGVVTEGLYFSRSVEWLSGSQNYGWSEFRFDTQSKKITSITFDYVINGTTTLCPASQNKTYYGESVESPINKTSYVELKIGGSYYQCKNSEMSTDGAWHTMTLDLGEGANLQNVLVKLHHFQGEMIIANVVFTYAE